VKKILIFIVVLIATSLISGVAYSKAKGTISGRVTDPSGNGIANVSVDVFDLYDIWTGGSSTDGNGYYGLKVPAGTYTLHFSPLPTGGYYVPQWYDNKNNAQAANANLVTVIAFRTTFNINAQLQIGGAISGQVTDASANGIINVAVAAFDPFDNWMGGSTTDSNGEYMFNVPAGSYKVHFKPLSSNAYDAPEWYDNKNSHQVADLVTVTASQITFNVNAQLEAGGIISGRVTDPSGNPIANPNVNVYAYDPDYNWMSGSSTDSDGNYMFNVPTGTWKIRFSPLPSRKFFVGYYAHEWYDSESRFGLADLVSVTVLQTTSGINGQIEIGGKVSGQVTDVSGNGINNINVNVFDLNNNFIASTTTYREGLYRIVLPVGDYKVGFFTGPETIGNYATKWFNNKNDFQHGDIVKVMKLNNMRINVRLQFK